MTAILLPIGLLGVCILVLALAHDLFPPDGRA